MTRHDAEFADRLDRYLDEVAEGTHRSPNGLTDLEPEVAETVRRLRAHDDAPIVDPRFAQRLLEDLMQTATPFDRLVAPREVARPGFEHNRFRLSLMPQIVSPLRQRMLAHFATAALLLLTLVGSVLVIGPGRAWRPQFAPALLPAISGTPSTSEMVVMETLLDATTDALPGGHLILAVERLTLQPSSKALIMPAMPGVVVVAAESGDITAKQGDTETQLLPGAPFFPSNQEVALQVTGQEDATAFAVYLISAFVDAGSIASDPVVHRMDRLIETSADDLPSGPARVIVERLTLPSGSALPSQEASPWVWTEVAAGALELTLEGENLPFRWKSGQHRTFRNGQYLPALRPGTRMTIRNADDVPLVLYRLTLTPSGSDVSVAILATPELAGVATKPMLDLVIPSIGDDQGFVAIDRYTFPPATTLDIDMRGAHIPSTFLLISGELEAYALDVPAPVRVIRAGGTGPEEVMVNRESVRLAPGDAIVVPENGSAELRNLAAEPAVLLFILQPSYVVPPNSNVIEQEMLGGSARDLKAPLAVSLRQATIDPEATLPGADDPDVEQIAVPVDPDRIMDARRGRNGSLRNGGDEPLDAYVLTVTSNAPMP